MVAGGAALLGTGLAVEAQDPKAAPPTPTKGAPPAAPAQQGADQVSVRRASGPMASNLQQLGPLRELDGTWVGRGFNTISLRTSTTPPGLSPSG